MKKINVIGLGYIGLPTALAFAANGFEVVGVDYNEELVNKATEEFIKEQKTEPATITIKVNNDSKFAKYQLVSIK